MKVSFDDEFYDCKTVLCVLFHVTWGNFNYSHVVILKVLVLRCSGSTFTVKYFLHKVVSHSLVNPGLS